MKRKIVAAIIAGTLVLNIAVPSITASAAPVNKEVKDAQSQYAEMQSNLAKINEKINAYNSKIEPLVISVQNNKQEMTDLQKQMENTQQEIAQAKVKIAKQEAVLGNRLSDLYKSGGQVSYIELIFGATSFSNLLDRVEAATRLVTIDRNVVETLKADKQELDTKVKSIQQKTKKLEELNAQTEKELAASEKLKSEQQVLADQANAAQKEFDKKYLSRYEREIVSGQIAVLTSNSSSISALKSAISQITDLNNTQIKSPTVKKEIADAISKGKSLISQKEAEAQAQAQAEADRGGNASGGSNNGGGSNGGGGSSKPAPPANTATAQAILNTAYKYLGKPYVWGATGPDSFDCSGFTSFVYEKVTGRWIGRTTYDQINVGTPVSRSQLQPGDLVFTSAGHVGIYVGNGNFINAPRTGSVVSVMPMWSFYAGRRIV